MDFSADVLKYSTEPMQPLQTAANVRQYTQICDPVDAAHFGSICEELREDSKVPQDPTQSAIPASPEQKNDSSVTAIEPNHIPGDLYTFTERIEFRDKGVDASSGLNLEAPVWLRIPEEFRVQQNGALAKLRSLSLSKEDLTILWEQPDGITDLSFVWDGKENEDGSLEIFRPADYLTGDGEETIQVISPATLLSLYSIDASKDQVGIGTFPDGDSFRFYKSIPKNIQEMLNEDFPEGYIDALDDNGVNRRYKIDGGLSYRVSLIIVVDFSAIDSATGKVVPRVVGVYPDIMISFDHGLPFLNG
ncbi:MAG: hypothetical protein QG570_267 [Patescibacteria group bacterium]|nr:hypothetical protein [Patescibacteria group bacterium]